jgi:hypothetical protein
MAIGAFPTVAPHAPPAPAAPVSRTGVVAADLACRRCSSNLAGLPVTSHCRECGTPVGISLYGERLKYGESRWIRGLARGAGRCEWAVVAAVGGVLAGAMAGGSTGQWASHLLTIAAGVLQLRGAWLLTAPDPAGQIDIAPYSVRWSLRAAAAASLAGTVLLVFHLEPLRRWMPLVSVVTSVLALAAPFVTLHFAHLLSLRVPDVSLARRARVVRWAYCGALAVAVVTLNPLLPPAIAHTRAAAYTAVASLVALSAYGLMYALLLRRLRRALSVQGDFAQGLSARARDAAA